MENEWSKLKLPSLKHHFGKSCRTDSMKIHKSELQHPEDRQRPKTNLGILNPYLYYLDTVH